MLLKLRYLLCLILFIMPISFATEINGFTIIQNGELDFAIEWDESSDRLQSRVLYGNPSEEGLYIIRVRFPAGASTNPHHHDQDRFVTVIEGIWYTGMDASKDLDETLAIPRGGFMVHPAGAIHYDAAKNVPAIVEIRGWGPVTTTRVE